MDDDLRELTPGRRQHWRVETDTDDTAPEVSPVRVDDRFEAKRLLWRDSATILVGVVVALLAVQLFLRFAPATLSSSPSPASEILVGPGDSTGSSSGPGSTLGPVVDPSLGIDVRPTRRPQITLPPTGSQPPTPGATPRPTRAPTAPPTAAPTQPPVTDPPVTDPPPPPPPPPNAQVTCDAPVGQTVTCTSSSTDILSNSEVWDMGAPGVLVSGGNGSSSITWTYTDLGPFTATVTLTVTGADGSTTDSDTAQVDIP